MRGGHCIKSWSVTQKHITLSSAEAELMAAVKTSTEVMGILQLMGEIGVQLGSEVLVDSSAALAAVHSKGNGRLRHVRVGHLWIQQVSEDGELQYQKVDGVLNPADLMTKSLTAVKIQDFMTKLKQTRRGDRAAEGLALK